MNVPAAAVEAVQYAMPRLNAPRRRPSRPPAKYGRCAVRVASKDGHRCSAAMIVHTYPANERQKYPTLKVECPVHGPRGPNGGDEDRPSRIRPPSRHGRAEG